MSTTEADGVTVGVERPVATVNRRRRSLALLGSGLVVATLCAWWWVSEPRLEGGGFGAVWSPDHEVVMGRGPSEAVYMVPADGPGSTTVGFGIRNAGRLPVELVDVWPTIEGSTCLWQPTERRFQDDPRLLGTLDERARPVSGVVLEPGEQGTVWVTGAQEDPDGCVHAGFSGHEEVEVVTRILGRTDATVIPLGYLFGYSDAPERLRDSFEVRVWPPTEPES